MDKSNSNKSKNTKDIRTMRGSECRTDHLLVSGVDLVGRNRSRITAERKYRRKKHKKAD